MTVTERRQSLPSAPISASKARAFVESALAGAGLEHLAYTATLLVSELVANAVLHSGTPLEVVVQCGDGRARIEVHDGNPALPVRKHYSNLSGTGRGLLLVERLASGWGSERTAGGKLVWFELDARSVPAFDILDVEAI
ncbi:MAG TPA: ATP-binding protein [Acidimicrobiales bacterium]|nr:ATP-binding protein [Acidimicrobiales bacterium]